MSKYIRVGASISGYIRVKNDNRRSSLQSPASVIDFNSDKASTVPVWLLDSSANDEVGCCLETAFCGKPYSEYVELVDELVETYLDDRFELQEDVWQAIDPRQH